jgi:hypothetical protein
MDSVRIKTLGKMAWVAIFSSFLPHSHLLLNIWGVFLMEIVPLEAARLYDPQLSWDGYLMLFSPKSSFHGTITIIQIFSSLYLKGRGRRFQYL